jgi:hypothetical protein
MLCAVAPVAALAPIRHFVSHGLVTTTVGNATSRGEVWEYYKPVAGGSLTRDDVVWARDGTGPTVGNFTTWTHCRYSAAADETFRLAAGGGCTHANATRRALQNCTNEFAAMALVRPTGGGCSVLGQEGRLYAFASGAVRIAYCMRGLDVVLGFNVSNSAAAMHQSVAYYYFAPYAVADGIFAVPPICKHG